MDRGSVKPLKTLKYDYHCTQFFVVKRVIEKRNRCWSRGLNIKNMFTVCIQYMQ